MKLTRIIAKLFLSVYVVCAAIWLFVYLSRTSMFAADIVAVIGGLLLGWTWIMDLE